MTVKPKRVLILGGSSDIGISTARIFLRNNWKVSAHYYETKKNFNKIKFYKNLDFFKFDCRNIYKFNNYISKNKSYFKSFDAFVNLTGYLKPSSLDNLKLKDLYDHINVNYISGLLITKVMLQGMKKRKWGRIVLSSSIGTKFGGGEKSFASSLAKFINEFFPSHYKKFYSDNITINTMQIGITDTKIHNKLRGKNMKQRIKKIPIRRMAKTDEVANYIFDLCKTKNNLITNTTINISGGE